MKSLGVVSNCWRAQLERGEPLEGLIDEAVGRKYRAVELRQTCLGRFERHDVPDAKALASFPKKFPTVRFNIALAVPIWSGNVEPTDSLFASGVDSAWATAGALPPHLRLVDPITPEEQVESDDERIARQVADLTLPLYEMGGMLSIENARLPWERLASIFATAKGMLGPEESSLKICYDPCNLFPADGAQAGQITRSLAPKDIAMVHFKQSRDGAPLTTMTTGDVDWDDQLRALDEIRYEGPALFEIAPHDDIWKHLDSSRQFVGL